MRDNEAFGSRVAAVLGFAREEKGGILQRESHDFDVVAIVHVFAGQTLVIGG